MKRWKSTFEAHPAASAIYVVDGMPFLELSHAHSHSASTNKPVETITRHQVEIADEAVELTAEELAAAELAKAEKEAAAAKAKAEKEEAAAAAKAEKEAAAAKAKAEKEAAKAAKAGK